MNSRKCDVCFFDVRRASYVKTSKSKKHLKKQNESKMIIPEWLFRDY